jgi:PAS domain S-box-containing protein
MVVANDDRRWVDANAPACAMLHLKRDELLELTIDDLTPPELRAELERLWERLMRARSMTGTFRFVLPDGRALPFDYIATAHIGEGRHIGVVVPTKRTADPRAKTSPLSGREREVLQRVALGQDGPEIAEDLVVSPATVRTHIGNAIRKLGARSRAHAVAIALRDGVIDQQ